MHRHRKRFRKESGQATVEFALVLPLLLVVLVGMIDFGFAFNYWIQETQLASEGARYAAVNRVPGGGSLQDYIRSQATKELRDGGTAQVKDPLCVSVSFPDGKEIGDPVRVTVETQYSWRPILEMVAPSKIKATATMRLEAIPNAESIPEGPACA